MKKTQINSDLVFDSRMLQSKIKNRYRQLLYFAPEIPMTIQTLRNKLRTGHFSLEEMIRIRDLLNIPHKEMADYFLTAYPTGETAKNLGPLDTYDTEELIAALERRSSVTCISVPTEDKLRSFLGNLKHATVLVISKESELARKE